jgi:hypothetical protein
MSPHSGFLVMFHFAWPFSGNCAGNRLVNRPGDCGAPLGGRRASVSVAAPDHSGIGRNPLG